MKTGLVFVMLIAVCLQNAHARILNVPSSYATIQAGINASVNGDTVLVEPGTYSENIIFRGKRIVLTSRYYLNSDVSFIVTTIIDGSQPAHPDSGSCVRITNGEDSTTVLQGFTLAGGYGTLWFDENGSSRYWEGGGVLIALCSPTVKHNIIRNNNVNRTGGASTGGGGIRLGDGKPYILNNIIINNAALYGGGIVSNYASPTIRNNIIAFNVVSPALAGTPTYGGGGIWINGSLPGATVPNRIENNTIVGNSATGSGGSGAGGKGGGMLSAFSATINSRNNIVWGNTQSVGGQINVASGSTALATYSDVEGGYAGVGNINVSPMFTDTSFYLLSGSACIDAGDTSVGLNDPPNPSNPLLAQWPSLGAVRNDMGAYGGPWRKVLGSIVTSVPERIEDAIPLAFVLGQNYPNPFNPNTQIRFGIATGGFVSLKVFDILGREVRTLVDKFMNSGNYKIDFNSSGLTSGAYFYRLKIIGYTQTKRMVLLR